MLTQPIVHGVPVSGPPVTAIIAPKVLKQTSDCHSGRLMGNDEQSFPIFSITLSSLLSNPVALSYTLSLLLRPLLSSLSHSLFSLTHTLTSSCVCDLSSSLDVTMPYCDAGELHQDMERGCSVCWSIRGM